MAVRDLTAEQTGNIIRLRFRLPTESVDGGDLTKPLEFEFFRQIESSASKPRSAAPADFGPGWVSVSRSDLNQISDGKVEYKWQLSSEEFKKCVDNALRFELRALTRGFRGRPIESDPSNVASLTLLDAPQPITGLAVEVTQDALKLHWSSPTQSITGKPSPAVSKYRVYRSGRDFAGSNASPYVLIGEPQEPSYADEHFEFGHSYFYKVRAVATTSLGSAESLDSTPVEVVPRDTFPPAAPAGLSGLYTSGAVELVWDPNGERDLAGYNIQRRDDGGNFVQLNRELLRSPLYRDRSVSPGHRYIYRTTAVDLSGNESSASAEVEVDMP